MRLGRSLAIFLGVDIGPAAGEEEPVEGFQELARAGVARIGGDHEGHTIRDLGNRVRVHLPARMGRILVVEQILVADNTDQGARHRNLFCIRVSKLYKARSRLTRCTRLQAAPAYPARPIPASAAAASFSELSPVTPTAPTTAPSASLTSTPPGTGIILPPSAPFTAAMK